MEFVLRVTWRTVLLDRVWRLTHPRAARTRARQQQQYKAALAEAINENAEWLAIALKPDASPEELRAVVNQYVARRMQRPYPDLSFWDPLFAVRELDYGEVERCPELQRSLCAHPNLPLDVFNRYFEMTPFTVAGILSNPVCPLWLLEKPDFFHNLPPNGLSTFAYYALKHSELPAPVARLLTTVAEPWLALEAKTHRSLPEDILQSAPLDLDWLDRQVMEIMQEAPYQPAMLHLLRWHGLIPSVPSGALPEPSACRSEEIESEVASEVDEWVRQAKVIARRGRLHRRRWRRHWRWNDRIRSEVHGGRAVNRDIARTQTKFARILEHPELPSSTRRDLYTVLLPQWLFHLPLLQQPDVPAWFVRRSHEVVLRRVLANFGDAEAADMRGRGAFYLVLRDMRDGMAFLKKSSTPWIVLRGLFDEPFLVRLAVALRLDDSEPEHREVRNRLLDDPNRYVRAAARKEIVWSKRTA